MRRLVTILLFIAGFCVTAKGRCPQFEPGLQVGTVAHYSLDEVSGIAASRQNNDVLWVHNDHGGQARVWALNTQGTHLGIYNLSGADDEDYEDIAIGPGPTPGVDYLYVGNIGDNDGVRSWVEVYRVAEPVVDSQQSPIETTLTGVDTIKLQYPDGPRDAETLMVDPVTKDIYIISKRDNPSRIYRAPYPQSTTTTTTMEYKCELPWDEATAGDISLDGDKIIVRTDNGVASIWPRPAGTNLWDAFSETECSVPLLWEQNGEAICFDANGYGYYTTSEGVTQPIYYFASVNTKLSITEIMSASAHSGGTDGDWWELTYAGSSTVDLTGYSWDDNSNIAGTVTFGNITISPGESIIILDDNGSWVTSWKSQWALGSEVNVYDHSDFSGAFPGLGSSDGVFLYNPGDRLVTSVTYPSRTTGISNEWDTGGTFLGPSVIGENGAYQSLNASPDVGSPGYAVHIETPCTTLAGMVYWTDKDASKIQRANYNCGGVEDLLTVADGLIDPRGIAIDLTSRKMYWADNDTNKIHQADLDGSNVEDVVVGLSYPADIALDLSDGKIYWADHDAGKIQRKNLDGTGSVEDVITGITQPYYLALDIAGDKIYWSDFDNSIIHRANFNGSGVEDFITGLDRVRDIALDVAGGKIYWGDRDTSKVQRANLDGTGIEDLFGPTDGLDRPHGLALDTAIGKMFWTDTATHTVYIANMDGSGSADSLATGLSGPWGIAIISTRQIIHVDADAPGPLHDGLNWHDAYLYLPDALDVAASGDEIRVAQGTYIPDQNSTNPSGSSDREATFQLINGVALKGGYAGYGEPDPDKRDIEAYKSILSGDLDGNDVEVTDACDLLDEPTRAENGYHVVTGSGIDETAVLDGFTIAAGNANGSFEKNNGGGMYNGNVNPTVINCTFIGNSAASFGGGINNGGNMTVINCTFSDNVATVGGGMANSPHASPIVTNCTFSSNFADQIGGGMYNGQSNAKVVNCSFNGNLAVFYGGGMSNYELANPIVTNCTFSGNSADVGGGLYNDHTSDLAVTNSIFWNNNDSGGVDESAQVHNDGSTSAVNYNCVQGWTGGLGGSGNHGDDPLFVDADGADDAAGTEDDDLHLLWDSACINAGDPCVVFGVNERDIDDEPRVMVGRIDMGADEVGEKQADFSRNGKIDFEDLNVFVQSWLSSPADIEWYILCDLYENDKIDFADFADFATDWLWQATWYTP